ncbi:hypothetical protein [Burkholderia sp. YIM B11467]
MTKNVQYKGMPPGLPAASPNRRCVTSPVSSPGHGESARRASMRHHAFIDNGAIVDDALALHAGSPPFVQPRLSHRPTGVASWLKQ